MTSPVPVLIHVSLFPRLLFEKNWRMPKSNFLTQETRIQLLPKNLLLAMRMGVGLVYSGTSGEQSQLA